MKFRNIALVAASIAALAPAVSNASPEKAAALRGRAIYYGKGNCFDCHASDAKGVTDYGAPALTGPTWIYGGDRESLYQSIVNGRHGKCPDWINVLTPVQIRALALYLIVAAGERGP